MTADVPRALNSGGHHSLAMARSPAAGDRSASEPKNSALDGEPRPERQQHPVLSLAGLVNSQDVFEHQ
jgi:hypothetical protein